MSLGMRCLVVMLATGLLLPILAAAEPAAERAVESAPEPPPAGERGPRHLPPTPKRPADGNEPTQIWVNAWFADISRIDSAAQTFDANLAIVLRWRDARLAHDDPDVRTYEVDEVWHPRWLIANEGSSMRRSLPETVDVAPDGSVVYRQRFLGSFSQALDLHRFPFDRAVFRVHMVLVGQRPEEISFLPDPIMVATGLADAAGAAEQLTLQDWDVTRVSAETHGYQAAPGIELAGYAIEFEAERLVRHQMLKVVLPLALIVLMSWAVFWIDPTLAAPQVSVAVTSMLTLIAYRSAVDADVPHLPYLTLLDIFMLSSSVLVFFSLVEVLFTTGLAMTGRMDLARRLDFHARWIFPLGFAAVGLDMFVG